MRTANNEKIEYFQPETFYLYPHFSEKKEKLYVQAHLPYPNNNPSKNHSEKALGSTKPNKNSSFLCPLRGKVCYDW